jgi:hypothetical protein
MILKLSASGWFLFSFIIDDARSHEREEYLCFFRCLCRYKTDSLLGVLLKFSLTETKQGRQSTYK